jgi:hypothetical protein
MKPTLFFFLIALVFTDKIYIKRDDNNYDHKMILVGFGDTTTSQTKGEFALFFRKNKDFSSYKNLNVSVSVVNNATQISKDYIANCENKTLENLDIKYQCSFELENQTVAKIKFLRDYTFYEESGSNTTIYTDISIIESPLALKAMEDITDLTNALNDTHYYYTFSLGKIEQNNGRFKLIGNLSENLTEQESGDLILSEEKLSCIVSNDSIVFNSTKSLFDNLNGKIAKINATKHNYVLIFSENEKESSIYYSNNTNSFIEIIDINKFKSYTDKNATATIYFRGAPSQLNYLKKYLRFTALLGYNEQNQKSTNLRNLQSTIMYTNVTVEGTKGNLNENEIANYGLDIKNTSGKNIISLTSNNDYEFSEYPDFSNPIKLNILIDNKTKTNLLNNDTSIPETFKRASDINKNSYSFGFDFDLTNKMIIPNNETTVILSYPSQKNISREEINCTLSNLKDNLKFKILCQTQNTINTLMKNIYIIVPELSSRLRVLYDGKINRTLYAPTNDDGIIDYEFIPNVKNPKKKHNGLSAGAIVALVLSTVAVVAAVMIAIMLFSQVPPNDRVISVNEIKMVNSNSNINQ